MTPYRRILCPVDFSEISHQALEWARSLAAELGAELIAVHVVDTTALAVGNMAAVPRVLDDTRRRAEESWRQWRRTTLPGETIRFLEGSPADAIVDVAEKENADLVVMGTHGLSGVQRFLLGSVTEKVLHRIRAPLLTVSPRSADEAANPPGKPGRVLAAIDLGPESKSVVHHAVWLAEHYGAQLVAVSVIPVPYVVLNDNTLERLTPDQVTAIEETLTRDRRRELSELLPETTGVPAAVVVRVGLPFETLREVIEAKNVDLAVLGAGGHGTRGISWLGSTCHKLVRAAPCPILTVR